MTNMHKNQVTIAWSNLLFSEYLRSSYVQQNEEKRQLDEFLIEVFDRM